MDDGYILITGASGGIGAALAMEYAKNGHSLILVSRSRDKLDSKQNEIKANYNVRTAVFACDVSKTADIDALTDWLGAKQYRVGTLINNAGVGYWGRFVREDPGQIERMLSLNVLGLTYLTRRILDHMKGRGGTVLNVASAAALIPPPPMVAAYAASKTYVRSFSEALAYELRKDNIRVAVLYPPDVETGFQREAGASVGFSLGDGAMTAADVARIAVAQLAKGKKKIVPRTFNDTVQDRLCRCLPRAVYCGLIEGMVQKRIAR